MTAIELVVTDLDGTLWPEPTAAWPAVDVHDRTRGALRQLSELGIPVIAATARRRLAARRALASHDLVLDTILHDGALGITAHDTVFHACAFTDDARIALLDVLDRFDCQPVFECDAIRDGHVETLIGDRPSFPREFLGRSLHDAIDLRAPIQAPVYSAFAAIDDEAAGDIVAAIKASGVGLACASHIKLGTSTVTSIKIRPATCSKWIAVERYCAHVGVDPSRVLAIGDNDNDVELLANAKVALAPITASPAAVTLAHHLVAPAAEGGWAQVLDYL